MLEPNWVLVMPVKRLSVAKTRLRGALPGVPHEELVLALAQDTVAAAVRCARVLVVTDDPVAGRALAALGASVAPEGPGPGLNAALSHGADLVTDPGARVAALIADLPALHADELAAALAAAGPGRAFVADAAGTGTTLLVAGRGEPLAPRFGAGSAMAHAGSSARELTEPWPTLRRDVDTAAELAVADRLGLGRRTRSLVHSQSLARAQPPVRSQSPVRAQRARDDRCARLGKSTRYGAHMQGTVATYDAETRSGTLLLDDGREIAFPGAAVDAAGLRLLRPGQRVRIDHDATGRVVCVTLPAF